MTEQEKQIEEMARVIGTVKPVEIIGGERYAKRVFRNTHIAEHLYNAGYRKVVMCKDCADYNGHRYCLYYDAPVLDNDYCSYAEMKGAE